MSKIEPNYFLVNRSLLHSARWLSEPFTRGQAWVDLFGLAQHTKGFFRIRGIKVDVDRGQLAYSQVSLAKRWKWSRGKVIRYLNELENNGDIVQQNTEVTTIISISKYDLWQGQPETIEQQTVQQTDSRRTANGTHTKNVKNGKKTYIRENEPLNDQVTEVYNHYVEVFGKDPTKYRLSDGRRQKIKARLKEFSLEEIKQAISNAAGHPFYSGGGERGWIADLDYICQSYEKTEKLRDLPPQKETVYADIKFDNPDWI